MFKKLLIALGLIDKPQKAITISLEDLLKETKVKKAPAKKKAPVKKKPAKKVAKKAPVKKKAKKKAK